MKFINRVIFDTVDDIYFEMALIVNYDMYQSKYISYRTFKEVEDYLLKKSVVSK